MAVYKIFAMATREGKIPLKNIIVEITKLWVESDLSAVGTDQIYLNLFYRMRIDFDRKV